MIALLIAGIVSAFTLVFDGLFAWRILRRLQARDFPRTEGIITRSEVRRKSGTYRFDLGYDYTVDGVRFHGDRYRYGYLETGFTVGGKLYEAVLRDYSLGAKVDVYYRPEHPADAVLKTGIDGWDLVIALLLTPLNVFMISLWMAFVAVFYRSFVGSPDAGGFSVAQIDDSIRIRLPQTTPFDAVIETVIGGSLGSALLISLLAFALSVNPSPSVVTAVIAGLAVVSAGGFYRRLRRINSGVEDLVINFNRQLLVLPQTFGREQSTEVPLQNIVRVAVEDVVNNDGEGTTHYFAPTLVHRDSGGSERRAKLAEGADQQQAQSLASWLATNITDARKQSSR